MSRFEKFFYSDNELNHKFESFVVQLAKANTISVHLHIIQLNSRNKKF